ncbi:MAG: carbonate dehydratase [Acidobacteriota bacterium]|nr:carbonate dehydratase [Acidobacteriota bacterium]
MESLEHLLENNQRWSARVKHESPDFFEKLSELQTPKYLWIGCSDSRISANLLLGLQPGEIFVHRNVANVVVHSDLNCLSVIQYAVEVLKVEHIIVCGHYGCGGIKAALDGSRFGLIDNWLRHIQDVAKNNAVALAAIEDYNERWNRLCEQNVVAQLLNVCETTIVQDAWERGQHLVVHGWIYSLSDGLINELGIAIKNKDDMLALRKNI